MTYINGGMVENHAYHVPMATPWVMMSKYLVAPCKGNIRYRHNNMLPLQGTIGYLHFSNAPLRSHWAGLYMVFNHFRFIEAVNYKL